MSKTNVVVHQKLVRDLIPITIMDKGCSVKLKRINDDAEYADILLDKLNEERLELQVALYNNYTTEEECINAIKDELADLYTILDTVRDICGISGSDMADAINNKIRDKGAFEERLFLEEVETYEGE